MKTRAIFILCFVPLLISFLISYILSQGILPNAVFVTQFSFDTAAIVSWSGLGISLIALVIFFAWRWLRDQLDTTREQERDIGIKQHKRFLQRLDHEIKNPLTTIQLGLVNILNGDSLSEGERKSLERIKTQSGRLHQLVIELRALTELEDRMVERNSVDLAFVLRTAIELSVNPANRNIELSVQQIPWGVGAIVGDIDLLMIAFTNLLNNAIKFTSDDGTIHIQIKDDGQSAVIEIADNGIGIPSSEVPLVFDELYRASNAQRMNGSGMGLALVQRIIELHHGSLSINSREGHGTSISVQLPLANKQ